MSDELLPWLNDQVGLSKKITSIEDDFANGYLIGEVLSKFKQITTFKEMSNKDDKETKLRNFGKLEVALRNMQIKLDSKMSDEIFNKKKGVVMRLLFSIKMFLEKKGINKDNLAFRASNQINNLYNNINHDTKKLPFEHTEQTSYKVKDKPNVSSYNKYEAFKAEQERIIFGDINKEKEEKLNLKNTNISQIKSISNKQHSQLIETDNVNKINWVKSIERKVAFQMEQENIRKQEADKYQAWLQSVLKVSNQANEAKIDYFEKNLSRLGLDINDDKLKKGAAKAMMSSEMVIQKIKEKIAQNQNAKKERDRRKRKIAVDQSKAQAEMEKKKEKSSISLSKYPGDKISSKAISNSEDINKLKSLQKINEPQDKAIEERDIIELNFSPKNLYEKEAFLKEVNKLDYRRLTKEIAGRIERRVVDAELCKGVLDLIFDIADDAYQYQVMNKSELIEAATWKEWMQIFISNENQMKNFDENSNIISNNNQSIKLVEKNSIQHGMSFINNESFDSGSDMFSLEDCELIDYLNYLGQWSVELIPSQSYGIINLQEILNENNAQTERNNKIIRTKRSIETQDSDQREEDPDNLVIPKEPVYNPYLGDIIDMLIDLKFSEKPEKRRNLLHYIPLKISLIGYSFGGKKTQAKLLTDAFPLKQYSIEDLIQKSIEILERLETPIEAHPKFKSLKKNQIDQMVEEKNKEEIKYAEIKKIAIIIRDARKENKQINLDEVYVNLFFEFLKFDFPEKSESQILEEITQKHKRRKEINEELLKIKEEIASKKAKNKAKEEQQLTQELNKINTEANRGIVLIDFPQTCNQARILENRLTAYIPEIEKPKTQLQIYRENLSILLERNKKQVQQKELLPGGLDIIFNIEVDSTVCIKRSILRRVDPNNGNIYHLEDNPPPNDNKVLDRLKPIDDPNASEQVLKNKHYQFDIEINRINELYYPFGIQEPLFNIVRKINGQKLKDQVFTSVNETLTKYIKIIDDKEALMLENKQHTMDEMNPPASYLNNQNNITSHNHSLNLNISLDHKNDLNNVVSDQNNEILSAAQTFVLPSLDEIRKKLPLEMRESLFKIFTKTYETYTNEVKQVFKFFRKQNDLIINGYYKIQQKFLDFIKRKNSKQQVILEYQAKYNKFLDDYPDLKDDMQLKEEHFHNIDDLGDKIWEIIDTRKTEAIEERRKITSQGWIENEMERTFVSIVKLFQCEIDKFLSFLLIIRDFFYTLENRVLVPLPQTYEILKEEIESHPIEHSEKINFFPRLEKLYKMALKVQFIWDDKLNLVEEKEKNSILGKEPKNKKNFSNVAKKMSTDLLIEKKEIYRYEEDFKNIIKKEKAKYRFRLILIKNWAQNRLFSFRNIANHAYEKLDNWIIASVKAENEALNNLNYFLKTEVDREEKLKVDIDMDPFETTIALDGGQFIEYQNNMYSDRDTIELYRFNLSQLRVILEEIRTYEIQKNYIRTSTFVEIYLKKYLCMREESEIFFGIPLILRKFSSHNLYKFIRNIDNLNTDILNFKKLSTILCLINAKICGESEETEIIDQATPNLVQSVKLNKENFLSFKFWFDSDDIVITNGVEENYNRIEYLKNTLFELNQDEDGLLNLPEFIRVITLKELNLDKEKIKNKTYFELLFF